jgi:cysteine-rich repeat protein
VLAGVEARLIVVVALLGAGCGRLDYAPLDADGGRAPPLDAGSADAASDGGPLDGRADAGDAARCGDGLVGGEEQCDDGDLEARDGCSPRCFIEDGWICSFEPSRCAPEGFAPVPAGTFTMGSPDDEAGRVATGENAETVHEVTLTRPFAISAREVTQAAYEAVIGFNPSHFGPLVGPECGPECPVERTSWYDGAVYANALSAAEGLPPCYVLANLVCGDGTAASEPSACMNATAGGIGTADVSLSAATVYDCTGYRYPTEAEWEYAARAGDPRATYAGELTLLACENPNPISDFIAWFCGNAGGTPHPTALLEPNAWGLYDMLGNVWEHVHDLHEPLPAVAQTDPAGAAPGATTRRVAKGGAWLHSAWSARAARRSPALGPQYQVGFRVARTLF